MPIECRFPITQVTQDEFHAIDKIVMKHAFDIQNELGRLCDEQVYKNELAYRCETDGLNALTEAEIRVTHDTFNKSYFLDMLMNSGGIYELKAAQGLHRKHSNQLINYLLLSSLHHGKLINFRQASVEHRFVSTNLTPELRQQFSIYTSEWDNTDLPSQLLEQIVDNLLNDWGVFLDISLYKAAIYHFLSPDSIHPVDIRSHGRTIGHQNICLLDRNTGIHISAVKEGIQTYKQHIIRLISHTDLARIQWINFSRNKIQLTTLKK
jgi:GxxExxY protein